MGKLLFAASIIVCFCASGQAQTTWYVDKANCPGPGTGTAANPFCKIQDGINAAAGGDTVLVAPGTYVENLDFVGKAITVHSQKGPAQTTIDANASGSAVVFQNGEGPTAVIEGFTMTNGTGTIFSSSTTSYGGGVACLSASPTIRGNVIVYNSPLAGGGIACRTGASPQIIGNIIANNVAPNAGGGVFCHTNCAPLLENNIIYGNYVAKATGGGLYLGYSSNATLVNNTISANKASGYGGMFAYQSTPVITNSIFWNNSPTELNTGTITYSVVTGGFPGTGNLATDPTFVDPANGDFHIPYTSPCRDTGDSLAPGLPVTDFEEDPRVSGSAADIGADEFHGHLYQTGNATPGGAVQLKFVGAPATTQVALTIGVKVLDPPLASPYGTWYMANPYVFILGLGPIPASGVYVVPGTLPPAIPGPYIVYLQAIVAYQLTNLCPLVVQ